MPEQNYNNVLFELNITEGRIDYTTNVISALEEAENEMQSLDETIVSIQRLKPECDKLDYILAASSGAICGLLDIFLIGKPGESPLGNITDKWLENRTMDFATMFGWKDKGEKNLSSAIRYLEKKFKIPYDQRGMGDAASFIFDLNASNHHFKSLGHNPSLLGLFFSILDQFTYTSHFVSGGELISLQEADGKFELRGNNIPCKLFCAFVNWFGHLISDGSGSSGSKGRGMGIPSPLWTWTNDIITIKSTLKIPVTKFDQSVSELALKLYEQGYDARFQTAQAIPVFINEMLVRLMYSVRRLVKYFSETEKENHTLKLMWDKCEPFKNPTVQRMLTVAHGTFCILHTGDAAVRSFATGGGTFNPAEFFLRLNIIGVGRFTISLYGEIRRGIKIHKVEKEVEFAQKEKVIVTNYIEGLKLLADRYDDRELIDFIDDLQNSGMYISAFEKSIKLAEKRNVPEANKLNNKAEIDAYFSGGMIDE